MGGSISTPADRPTVLYDKYLEGLASLEGKVIAITGCTTGTGFVAALTCAKKGAHVLMLNRASERADAALSKIKEAAPDAKVEHIDCDLTDFESVKGAAKALVSKCASGIDVLCNNAGSHI
jgi:NAD(P)-dependent dehydrogenase (short-subunit alcohol dehydrogenase family)